MSKMDSATASPSSKLPNSNMRVCDADLPEEVDASGSGQQIQTRDALLEKQKDSGKETESETGDVSPAVLQTHHKGAANRNKFSTLGHQKRQRQKVVSDFATVRKGAAGNSKARPALRQVLFNQGTPDKAPAPEGYEQVEALRRTLDSFTVPVLPDHKSEGMVGIMGLPLEASWNDIVRSHQAMEKTERHQQEALWELLHTELSYIYKLTIIKDLVMAALTHVHHSGFLQEISHEHLFSNLPSVLHTHHCFWNEVMLPMLSEARRTGGPLDPLMLEQGCLEFRDRFSPYLQYCWEQERMVEFARRQMDSNPLFHTYIEWVESCPGCARMRLGDMQAKPHQRITKYPLLLKAVLQATREPQPQYAVRKMLSSVNGFLDNINDHLRLKQEELALSLSAQRVEGYDLVEGMGEEIEKHVRDLCRFDLTSPIRGAGTRDIRKLLLEETLRIKERRESKLDAVVLLFSDVLLVTKPQRKSERLKVIRRPLSLDRIGCAALKDGCSFLLVEVGELGCAVNIYTVTAPSPESRTEWINTILSAQKLLSAMRERETSQRFEGFFRPELHIDTQLYPASEETFDAQSEARDEAWSSPTGRTIIPHENNKENGVCQTENGTVLCPKAKEQDHVQSQSKEWNLALQDGNLQLSPKFTWLVHGNVTISKSEESQLGVNSLASKSEEKEDSDSSQLELSEIIFRGLEERRVTWNEPKSRDPSPDRRQLDASESELHGNMFMLLGGDLGRCSSPKRSESIELLEIKQHSPESQPPDGKCRKDSWVSLSDDDAEKDQWRFSRRLRSPRLRRRRVIGSHHSSLSQAHKKSSLRLGTATLGNSINSSSDSDCNQRLGRKHSQATLNPGSVNRNHGMLWNSTSSRENHRTLFKSTSGHNSHKTFRPRTQANASVLHIEVKQGQDSGVGPSWLEASIPSSPPPKPCASPLEDILKRATNRERDKEKKLTHFERRNFVVLDFPRFQSPSPSPSLPPGGEEREREHNLAFDSLQSQPGLHKWKDVDKEHANQGRNVGQSYSSFYIDGMSVDWPGWCFDDDEVMVHLDPRGTSGPALRAGISEVLTSVDPGPLKEQEDQEFGEV